jgi:hypothetical protein
VQMYVCHTCAAISSHFHGAEALVHLLRCGVLQLKTSHLRSKAAQSLLAPLQSLMDKAASSISVPYVMHDVSGSVLLCALMSAVDDELGLSRVCYQCLLCMAGAARWQAQQ